MSAMWMAAMGLAMAGQEPLFRLVGLYDATGVPLYRNEMSNVFYETIDTDESELWSSKSPDGLGVFEAEAIANQLSQLCDCTRVYRTTTMSKCPGESCSQQEDGICEPVPRSITNMDVTVDPRELTNGLYIATHGCRGSCDQHRRICRAHQSKRQVQKMERMKKRQMMVFLTSRYQSC